MTIPYIPSRDIHLHHRILPFPFLLLITSTTTTIYYYYTPYSILVHSILPLRCVALSLPHPVLEPAQRACCDLSESNRVGKKDRIRQTKIDLVSSIKPSLRLSSFFFFLVVTLFPISINLLFLINLLPVCLLQTRSPWCAQFPTSSSPKPCSWKTPHAFH